MKKFKAALSVILCFVLLSAMFVFPTNAVDAYPESEHNYKNNFYQEWTYTYPGEAQALSVTFSEDTYVEEGDYYEIYFGDEGDFDLDDLIDEIGFYKRGDIVSVFDGDGNLVGTYQGNKLSGETIVVPGNSFKIVLITDSIITKYGFKVTDVQPGVPEDTYLFRYHMPDGTVETVCAEYYYDYYYEGIEIESAYDNYYCEGEVIIGWQEGEDGDKYYYNYGNDGMYRYKEPLLFDGEPGTYDLYALSVPMGIAPEDVYSFDNQSRYFEITEDGYYFTQKDYLRLVTFACVIGGVGPLAVPGAVMSWIVSTVPKWEWNGSCIGFSTTVCLQKLGILDVVGTQEGATCMSDLEPTPELISLLNYYNTAATATILSKDKAFRSKPEEFSRQLKKLYKSAEEGNIIDFQFHKAGLYHGYVVAGAYTDDDGNHFLMFYDENYGSDYVYNKVCRKMWISPDFTEIHSGTGNGEIEIFLWNDDFGAYKSIDINNDYSRTYFKLDIIRHIAETLIEWVVYYLLGVKS